MRQNNYACATLRSSIRTLTVAGLALAAAAIHAQTYKIATIAKYGDNGDSGRATEASLFFPRGVAVARDGNVYVSEGSHHRVRRIAPSGVITTYAGIGVAGFRGDGGPAAEAQLNLPTDLAVDQRGNLYILDQGNQRVRRVNAVDGKIQTVAGKGESCGASSRIATEIQFCNTEGIALDAQGTLHVSERDSGIREGRRIWRIDPSGSAAPITTGGLDSPTCMAFDNTGNLYICDLGYIKKRSLDGRITTLAGSCCGLTSTVRVDVPALNQFIYGATALAVDSQGVLHFSVGSSGLAPSAVFAIRDGILKLVTGVNGRPGSYEGESAPNLFLPVGLAFDAANNLYISEQLGHRVRRLSSTGSLTTVAGSRRLPPESKAPFFRVGAVAQGGVLATPDGSLLVGDWGLAQIRKVGPDGRVTNFAGNGFTIPTGDGEPALAAGLGSGINALALDGSGNLYLHSAQTFQLRQITTDGRIRTVAGNGRSSGPVGYVNAVAASSQGSLYFSDGSYEVKRVDNGIVTSYATALRLYPSGTPRPGIQAVAVSPTGIVHYIQGASVFRFTAGEVQLVAGSLNARPGSPDDGVPATEANLQIPSTITFDRSGNLYIGAQYITPGVPGVIWRVGPDGILRRIAGPRTGSPSTDGTAATQAAFTAPFALSVDATGKIFMALGLEVRALVPDAGSGCTTRLGRTAIEAPVSGGEFRIDVAAAFPCPWSVQTDATWIKSSPAGGSGAASVTLTLEQNFGEAREATVVIGETPVVVKQPAGPPSIDANGILSASEGVSVSRVLSPGGLMLLNGAGFVADPQAAVTEAQGDNLPEVLSNACVLVDGKRASLLSVSATQIKFISPLVEDKSTVEVNAVRNCNLSNEIQSTSRIAPYQAAAPEFLLAEKNPDGPNPVLAVRIADGEPAGRRGAPAEAGESIVVYGLGFGVTASAQSTDSVPQGSVLGPVAVTLGDLPLAVEDISFVGIVQGFPGIYQLQFRVPPSAPAGDLPLRISIGDLTSPPDAYLTVSNSNPN